MTRSNPKEIEEVFVIQTEAIGFFGALGKEKGGEFVVYGRVRFHDKEQWAFHSPAGERAALRNKLMTLGEAIAKFYGTDVLYQTGLSDMRNSLAC